MATDPNPGTYLNIRQKALATLRLIEDGHRFTRRMPDGRSDDYTSELKLDQRRLVEVMDSLLAPYDADNA